MNAGSIRHSDGPSGLSVHKEVWPTTYRPCLLSLVSLPTQAVCAVTLNAL